jgi:hypothetical protein
VQEGAGRSSKSKRLKLSYPWAAWSCLGMTLHECKLKLHVVSEV